MLRFSLKELLYWISVGSICVSLLTALTTAVFALAMSTIWLGGTVLVNKMFTNRSGFLYSIALGLLAFAALASAAQEPTPHRAQDAYAKWAFFLLLGLVIGTSIWGIAVGADKVFKRISGSDNRQQ
jgi:hypothetical protein